ncbi:MAG: hypothetical protein JJT94_03665 [Bernardetiaceae bacterium]|nr:hypothetical protein [Bernardetiaceae bacterium]
MPNVSNPQTAPLTDYPLFKAAVNLLESKGFKNLKVNIENIETYQQPAMLRRKGSEEGFIPALTAKTEACKHYIEIVRRKAKQEKKRIINKWALLSTMAKLRNGKFILLVPHGTMSFTNRILEAYPNIEAEVIKLKK